jgi:hypothetical protein
MWQAQDKAQSLSALFPFRGILGSTEGFSAVCTCPSHPRSLSVFLPAGLFPTLTPWFPARHRGPPTSVLRGSVVLYLLINTFCWFCSSFLQTQHWTCFHLPHPFRPIFSGQLFPHLDTAGSMETRGMFTSPLSKGSGAQFSSALWLTQTNWGTTPPQPQWCPKCPMTRGTSRGKSGLPLIILANVDSSQGLCLKQKCTWGKSTCEWLDNPHQSLKMMKTSN